MQEAMMFDRVRQSVRNSKFREGLLNGIIQMGGRIAIIITDDPRYLKRRLRTWTTLSVNDLHQTRHYNRHSKLVFIVQDLKELPAAIPFLSCATLLRDSKNRRVVSLRSQAHPTGISTSLGNLELFLNYLAIRPNPSHFFGSHAMNTGEYSSMFSCKRTSKPPPGIVVIGAPSTKKSTLTRLKERTGTEGAYYIPPHFSTLFRDDDPEIVINVDKSKIKRN